MIDEPIRRKQNNYPKDFTPSQRIHNSKVNSKATQQSKEQFSFSCRRETNHYLNRSTQLENQQKQDAKLQSLLTINPEEGSKLFPSQPQKQLPIINHHLGRTRPYLNPEILLHPKIQQKIHEQIPEMSQPEGQSMTPGSIKNNKSRAYQKPLQQESPASIFLLPRHDAKKKMNDTKSSFHQLLRNQQINISSGSIPKCASLGRGGQNQQSSSFRLAKKSSSSFNQTPRQSMMLLRNNQSPKKSKLLNFGNLLEEDKVNKLKQHINQFVTERSKHKNPKTHKQTQSDIFGQEDKFTRSRVSSKINRTKKILSASKFFPQLGGGQYDRFPQENDVDFSSYDIPYQENYPNIVHDYPINRQIHVTYKTSMNSLKQIYKTIQHYYQNNKRSEIQIKVPQTLVGLRINPTIDKQTLYQTALQLFSDLHIPSVNLTIKRYSNCIVMVAKTVSIIYHYSSKIYLGSWQTMYLDEGVRHGLGLEWVPNKYVYYGEYINNKREGLGVYKELTNTYIGQFRQSKRQGGFIINTVGEIFPEGRNQYQQNNNTSIFAGTDEYLNSEPALC